MDAVVRGIAFAIWLIVCRVEQIPAPAGEIFGYQNEHVSRLQRSALRETYFPMFGNLFAAVIVLIDCKLSIFL